MKYQPVHRCKPPCEILRSKAATTARAVVRGRSGQKCPAGAKYARGPRGNPAKRFPWGEEAQRNERVFPPRKTSDMKLVPTMGGASIASGYTPDALARAKPRHPQPPRGRKEFNAEKENSDHHRKNDTGHQRSDSASG